jgi:hypothetical protein
VNGQNKYDDIEGLSCGVKGFENGFSVVRKDGKRGLIDKSGKEVVPCIYDNYLYGFKCGLMKVNKNGKCGYVNEKGEEVIPLIYEGESSCSDFFNNIAVVKLSHYYLQGEYGCINTKGKLIVSPNYDRIDDHSDEGLIEYSLNGKSGMIDTLGNQVVSNIYESIGLGWDTFVEGFAIVTKNGKKGYINKKGKELIECIYEDACDFSDSLAAVKFNGKWGFINYKGKLEIQFQYDSENSAHSNFFFSGGFSRVMVNGNSIFIDKSGNKVSDCPYSHIENFKDGMAAVCKGNPYWDGKWGFVNDKLELIVPCIYSTIFNPAVRNAAYSPYFDNGIAIIATDNCLTDAFGGTSYYSFIDKSGKQMISWTKNWPGPRFEEGLAAIERDGKWGFVDKLGRLVIPCVYDDLARYCEESVVGGFSEGLVAAKKNGKWGFIDISGKIAIPFIYDEAFNFSEGLALVANGSSSFFIDKNGFCSLLCR